MLTRLLGGRWRPLLVIALALAPVTGCYYTHLAEGQWTLLWRRVPLDEAIASTSMPADLARRLELVPQVREFASELGLSVSDQYTRFVAWEGDRIITSVVATRPGEIDAAGFDFPFLGTLPYKGFFDTGRAEREAEALRADGLDVCLVPVAAYSTLGWIADPVTGPMLRSARSDGEFVETILHELVHATAFWSDDPDFSESIASFIGEEATIRFAARHQGREARRPGLAPAREWSRVEEDRVVAASLLRFRRALAALYQRAVEPATRVAARADLEHQARRELGALPLSLRDPQALADRARLNDACLALRGTYAADSPHHGRVLDGLGGDLPAFVRRMLQLAGTRNPREGFFAP